MRPLKTSLSAIHSCDVLMCCLCQGGYVFALVCLFGWLICLLLSVSSQHSSCR